MKPIELFIFDLDGTLVNTIEDIAASVNFTLDRLGLRALPSDMVRRFVGDGVDALLLRSLGERKELLQRARGIYTDHHRENLVVRSALYAGVSETLEYFKAVPMAVISNKTRDFCEPLLDRLGIRGRFRFIIGADNGLPLKPAPDSILKIMKDVAARKERTVVVGDGTTDVRAGKAAGVITCSVTYGFRSEGELKAAGPDFIIHEFSGLKTLFKPYA